MGVVKWTEKDAQGHVVAEHVEIHKFLVYVEDAQGQPDVRVSEEMPSTNRPIYVLQLPVVPEEKRGAPAQVLPYVPEGQTVHQGIGTSAPALEEAPTTEGGGSPAA